MDLKSHKKNKKEKVDTDDFIRVTEVNRSHAIKIGAKIYIIEGDKIRHTIIIRPRLTKGTILYADKDPLFKEIKIVNGESNDEYIANFKPVLDMVISSGNAYIKKGEKLITYSVKKI